MTKPITEDAIVRGNETITCECCGQTIDNKNVGALNALDLPTLQKRIIRALVTHFPQAISMDRLITSVYYTEGDDEPEYARLSLQVTLAKVRKKIEPFGWTIPKRRSGRGNFGSYKLEKLNA